MVPYLDDGVVPRVHRAQQFGLAHAVPRLHEPYFLRQLAPRLLDQEAQHL
jgi:hypothetical protein